MGKLKIVFCALISTTLFIIILMYFYFPDTKVHNTSQEALLPNYFNFSAPGSYSKSCCTITGEKYSKSCRCLMYNHVYLPPYKNCQSRECALSVQYMTEEQMECKQYPIVASRFDMVMYWNICSTNVKRVCSNVIDVGILPRRILYAGNIGHFTYDFLGNIVSLKNAINEDQTSTSGYHTFQNVALILPPFLHQLSILKFTGFFQALGITNTVQLGSTESISNCFKSVYLPNHAKSTPLSKDDIHFFQKYFNVSGNECQADNQLTILQRKGERSFKNISSLVHVVKASGFPSVVVVSFENMTIQEQMQMAYCSKVFMGVQGAGMTWSHYLPADGVLIEIGFELWKNDLYSNKIKSAGRHDIKTFNVKCSGVISQTLWQRYAKKHNVSGFLDGKKKQLITSLDETNEELKYGETIWKHASCLCEERHLKKVLENVKNLLFQ